MSVCAQDFSANTSSCQNCSVTQSCLPKVISGNSSNKPSLIKNQIAIKRGGQLAHLGDHNDSLYVVRSGSFKSYTLTADGRERTNGFYLLGEVIGLEAMPSHSFRANVYALEKSSVCELSLPELLKLLGYSPNLQYQVFSLFGKRLQIAANIPRNGDASERLAAFLIDVSNRYQAHKLSAFNFRLAMSRQEIGNYLGLALETVSRLLSQFQAKGLLTVSSKQIKLNNIEKLRAIAEGQAN